MSDHPKDIKAGDDDEYLTRVVIDTCARTFRLYSSEGGEKVVDCDCMEEVMNVLDLVRKVVDDDIVAYVGPLTATQHPK